MPRKTLPVLLDILRELATIERAIAGKSYEEFSQDQFLQRGVERCIEIVSEAARHIPENVLARHPEIPWRVVKGIGNILRHDYHNIRSKVVWDVVTLELPALKVAVDAMVSEERS